MKRKFKVYASSNARRRSIRCSDDDEYARFVLVGNYPEDLNEVTLEQNFLNDLKYWLGFYIKDNGVDTVKVQILDHHDDGDRYTIECRLSANGESVDINMWYQDTGDWPRKPWTEKYDGTDEAIDIAGELS